MLIQKIWVFQGTVSISSDFYLTFCLGKVEALCFSLIVLALIWIMLFTKKCCNGAIFESSVGREISFNEKFQNTGVLFQKSLFFQLNFLCKEQELKSLGSTGWQQESPWRQWFWEWIQPILKATKIGMGKADWNSCKTQESAFLRRCLQLWDFYHLFHESRSLLELAQGLSAAWAGLSNAIPQTEHWDIRRNREEKVWSKMMPRAGLWISLSMGDAVIQTSWSCAVGKTNHFAPWKPLHQRPVSPLKVLPPGHGY